MGIVVLSVIVVLIVPKPPKKIEKPTVKKEAVHTISLTAKGFEPKEITIKKDEFIVWVNNSGKTATVNSADHPTHQRFPALNLGVFETGQSVQIKFYNSGEYFYHNHFSPTQTGKITVK